MWNDRKSLYNVYRETIHFDAVESVSVWLQNIAPGRQTRIQLGPIRALPMAPAILRSPKITVAGKAILFPVDLPSGNWIECNGLEDCQAYGPKGELLGAIAPRGDWPAIARGVSPVRFECGRTEGPQPRARVTMFSYGEEFSCGADVHAHARPADERPGLPCQRRDERQQRPDYVDVLRKS